MNKRKLDILDLSDIHLGHKNTTTEYVIDSLDKYIRANHNKFKNLDMLIISGDTFDRLLPNNSPEFISSLGFLIRLAKYCKKHNIIFRILEGTPSHDWKQIKVLETSLKDSDVDFKYISNLYIERNTKLGIDILYVPDEWNNNGADTFEEVKELLKENQMDKVDLAIMHGMFPHQIPVKSESTHNPDDYLDIVRFYIIIGHDHKPSVFKRILVPGSFERLKHKEEENKGGLLVSIYKSGDMEFKFIENTNAKTYKTINYIDKTLEEIMQSIDKDIKGIVDDSYVRILVSNRDIIKSVEKDFQERYKHLNLKVKTENDDDEVVTRESITEIDLPDSFEITPDNITDLIKKELEKHKLNSSEIIIFDEEIKKVLENYLT